MSGIPKEKRVIGLPKFSIYAEPFRDLFDRLGLKVADYIPITDETLKFGVRHSPEMMCFPYKVILGNFIELMKKGANTLIMYSSCGKCKQRHYYKLMEQKLTDEGYEFEMIKLVPLDLIPLPLPRFMNRLTYLSGYDKLKLSKMVFDSWRTIAKTEKERYLTEKWGRINIGITGEIYTVMEPDINYHTKDQLEKMGATIHITMSVRHLITDSIWRSKERRQLRERCWDFFDKGGDPGGHGLHSVEDTLLWTDKGIDGIIHLTPLSCHPEIMVEDAIDYICTKKKIPLMRIKIDETISPLNIATRIETFYELIKRRKSLEVSP